MNQAGTQTDRLLRQIGHALADFAIAPSSQNKLQTLLKRLDDTWARIAKELRKAESTKDPERMQKWISENVKIVRFFRNIQDWGTMLQKERSLKVEFPKNGHNEPDKEKTES